MSNIDEQAISSQIPDELKRWNWGAFLLNWIWGIGNNTFIALLTFIPVLGILVMPFVLGAKGNEWAWRNRRWDSIEHFKRVQRRWSVAGFVLLMASASLFGAFFGGIFYILKTSEAYHLGVARLEQSREAADLLGLPIATSFPSGEIKTSGQSGQASLDFFATGRKAIGRISLQAIKKDGAWSLIEMKLRVEGHDDVIDLLKDQRVFLGPPDLMTIHWAA